MIIIFQCFGGTHTSIVAAAIYTGQLKREGIPCYEEVLDLPYFDRLNSSDMGNLHFVGPDQQGNLVFALGSKSYGKEMRELITQFLAQLQTEPPKIAVIDCITNVTTIIRMGGILSRRWQITRIGRPLVSYGIRRSFPLLLRQVESFEKNPSPYFLN